MAERVGDWAEFSATLDTEDGLYGDGRGEGISGVGGDGGESSERGGPEEDE